MIKTEPSLALIDQSRLRQCEEVIARGLTTFFEVGQALREVRDGKLYRATHKTFEAYCAERWELSRPRAYQLIDHAKVAEAVADAGVVLSKKLDISERDVAALKADLPAAAAEIKARVEQGEDPSQALEATIVSARAQKEKSKAEKETQQAEWDRQREESRAALSAETKAANEARQAAIDAAKAKKAEPEPAGITDAERIAELEEQVSILERDYTTLMADYRKFSEMEAQFKKGGFEAVIAGKDEVIRVAETRIYGESEEKVRWMNSAKYWKKQALALGWKPNKGGDVDPVGDAA